MEKIRIMMLEDVPFDAELAERELEQGNIPFSSLRVENEAEFKKGIKEFKPHIILADHSLPSFDGKSALKIAQEEIPQVPFIFFSGKIGGEFVVEVLREGAKDYVFKNNISKLPYTIKRALDEVDEALELQRAAKSLEDREAQLRLITQNIQDMVMQVDADGYIQYLSSSITNLLGYHHQDFMGQPVSTFFDLVHPEEGDKMYSTLERVKSSTHSVREEFRCKNIEGDYQWLESLINPVLDEYQEEKGYLLVIRDIDSRKKVEIQLTMHRENLEKMVEERTRELGEINLRLSQEIEERKNIYKSLLNNEKRLESIINGSPLPTFVLDNHHKVVYWNQALENFTGIKKEEVVGTTNQWHVFYQKDRPCMADLLLDGDWNGIFKWYSTKHMRSELVDNVYCATGFFPGIKNGRWLYMTAFPLLDSEGEIIGAVETLEDITQEVEYKEKIENSLKEKEILLKEIHHRVKNNLQIISSLISLQSNRIDDEETLHLFRKTKNRIQSMALVHEKLYQSGDFTRINLAEYIQDLVLNILGSYQSSERITLEMDCEPVWININTAIPCALIINELVTNSIKHAFPHDKTGKIIIKLHQRDDQIIITCTDTGVGLPDDINLLQTSTLGLKLVRALTQQLKGKIKILSTPGTSFEIYINFGSLTPPVN
ncbi:MAG: PAS domain S-box protein [Methanobacteriaceae archaeon]|nr:PAS domain S-box protein [Methanobacteriaceae archaeon]